MACRASDCHRRTEHAACRLLGLPAVDVDALGRPSWECTDADVSRAYRKLSLFVHPDKQGNKDNEKAREAFERLNEAHRILRDPAKRADELYQRLDQAKTRRAKAEANACLEERVALNAEKGNAVSDSFWPSLMLNATKNLLELSCAASNASIHCRQSNSGRKRRSYCQTSWWSRPEGGKRKIRRSETVETKRPKGRSAVAKSMNPLQLVCSLIGWHTTGTVEAVVKQLPY